MEVKEINYRNFGNCVQISNGIIDVVVTIEYGPRIIRFGFCGKENIFYEDTDRKLKFSLINADGEKASKKGAYFCYGGHRLLLGTENPASTMNLDNDPVVYSLLPGCVRFLQPKQKKTGLQAGIEIVMGEDASDIMVVHTAKNCSRETRECSLWPVTMVDGSGTVVLPQNTGTADSLHPNRVLTFWPGTDIRDKRLFFGTRYLTVFRESDCESPLKIGCNNVLGWMAFVGKHYTFMKQFVHNPQAVYPDFGSSCELRVQDDFTEMQTLSPFYRIEPGQGIKYVENLSLFQTRNSVNPKDEDGIARYIQNLK